MILDPAVDPVELGKARRARHAKVREKIATEAADAALDAYAENLTPSEAAEFRRNALEWRGLMIEAATNALNTYRGEK